MSDLVKDRGRTRISAQSIVTEGAAGRREIVWDESLDPVFNYVALGRVLARVGDLYRRPGYGDGLLLVHPDPADPPIKITSGRRLASVIVDRVSVWLVRDGHGRAGVVPPSHLAIMLQSETFLEEFSVVDEVVTAPRYRPDFSLLRPGYTDGGPGERLMYTGPASPVSSSLEYIHAFLDVMQFATGADRTNAVGAALTVRLRHLWPGRKPLVLVTASKSHAGKDTVLTFARGATSSTTVSYQRTDWAMEQAIAGDLSRDPRIGMLVIENVRLDSGTTPISSACIERMATSPTLNLFSTKLSRSHSRRNDIVIGISTNDGRISEDLANRRLPIHLTPKGDVRGRTSPIGDPRYEYLPTHQGHIDAELCGLIARWVAAGQPQDKEVRHPMTEWASVIGGILRFGGFEDFLGNYGARHTSDNPLREALGRLGSAHPDTWLRPGEWARHIARLGLVKTLIPVGDRDTDAGQERGVGKVMAAHQGETLVVEGEDERITLRLERVRQRVEGGEAKIKYRFVVESRERAEG